MPTRAFTVFQDQGLLSTATSATPSTCDNAHDTFSAATKENINPLTGIVFDSQPPPKKRKRSSSVLTAKPLPNSSSKSKRFPSMSSTSADKEKRKRKIVLGVMGSKNIANLGGDSATSEAEQLCTTLGNRNAYNLTVMPLADVTEAYDERGAATTMVQVEKCSVERITMETALQVHPEQNDIEMRGMTSKGTQNSAEATVA